MASGTAVITGATAGIGAEFARRLAERGHDLVLAGRRASRLEGLARELGDAHGVTVESLTADLARPEGLAAATERVAGEDVALLVNSAGINGYSPFAGADPAVLDAVVALNVTATLQLSRAALPGMLARGHGAIVNVASLLAFAGARPPEPLPFRATYAGTKGFVVAFTRTLAAEIAPTPVRVQVVCPGYTATEFHGGQSKPGAMEAADVVRASLLALDRGEVVCIPGECDPDAVDRLIAAEAGLLEADFSAPAARYAG